MKPEMMAMLRSRKTVTRTVLTPAPSGCSSLATRVGGEGAPAVGELVGPVLTWAAR